jgi:hypothetical protein
VKVVVSTQRELYLCVVKATVGIIPYVTTDEYNKFCHPIKLYLYFAMGIPVVSTPILAVSPYSSNYVSVSETAQEFIASIKHVSMVTISKTARKKYINYALRHTHEQKAKDLIKIIGMHVHTS